LAQIPALTNMEVIRISSPEMIPEIIFLDINLPMMDSFLFWDEFEKFSVELKSKIKVVILTISINPSDLEKSKKYERVVDYCYKPLMKEELDSLTTI
jgi:CheY-like chemotaxis protein